MTSGGIGCYKLLCRVRCFGFPFTARRARSPSRKAGASALALSRNLTLVRATAVAPILTRCSKTNQPIPTGLDSDMVVLETLPNVPIPVVCSACGSTHYWMGFNAWVEWEEERQLANAPFAARNIVRHRRAS